MYVKDMPSVTLSCVDKPSDRMNLDLVLDSVADDRIEAAYAIVELGERGSRKEAEFPLAEEEELDVDEAEQYQQVPRSPECLREYRRGASNRSVDTSPVRGTVKPLEHHLPKIVHVKGAVMPTRATGNPVRKLPLKRRHENDLTNCGIKAKLARMLIERKCSQEEAGKSCPGYGTCQKNDNGVDSDEEQNIETACGRFVRTSAPVLEPVNVISQMQSPMNSKYSYNRERLELKSEQSMSAEEINKLRNSLQRNIDNEQTDCLLQGDDSRHTILSHGGNTKSLSGEVYDFKTSESSRDGRTYASEISSNYVPVASSLRCSPNSLFQSKHLSVLDRGLDVSNSRIEAGCVPSQPAKDGHYFLLGSTGHLTSTSGTAGLLQYYMLPVIKSLPNSINSEFRGIEPVMSNDVDALKRLEKFSLGSGYCSEPVLKYDPVVSETQRSSFDVLPLAKRYCQKFGSLNSISNYYSVSNGPVSEAGHPISGSLESLSLQNLSGFPRDSPNLTSVNSQKQLFRSQKRSVLVNESKKLQSSGDGLLPCTKKQTEAKMDKPGRKTSAILDALEMIKGGEFGSLRTIRNLYTRMRSRNVINSSTHSFQNTRASDSMIKTEYQSVGFREQDQELPLDLSKCCRRISYQSTEVDKKSYHPEPSTFETFPSVDLYRNANCDSYSRVEIDNHVMQSDILPLKVNGFAAVKSESNSVSPELTDKKNSRKDDNVTGSSTYSVPNSHLPPKKRKLRQTSQNCDFSESKTSSITESTSSCQGLPDKLKSCVFQIYSSSCPDEKSETLHGEKISETEMKVLPDAIKYDQKHCDVTEEESALLSAVAVRDEDGDLPLHIAVAQGCVDIVQKLLPVMSQAAISVDICNNSRQTALHLAVISNQPKMVDLLLSASASANVCDRKGNTSIHLAVKYKTLLCLKKILSNSRILLNLDARNYEGLTALHIGVQLSQTDAVKALLIGGANPNAMDGTNGRTPLFNAVENDDYAIASTLLQHGSDPCIASYSGCTPLQIASAKSLRDMTSILERSGREWIERI